ncbi:hypothetical protein LZC95_21305 [Pendulispora brunnea]|uniref:Thioesterase family protein n=1 Tax=Pendulispora brunnea TaxID=2905690 RepID=A0ABZ2KL06_9BACT
MLQSANPAMTIVIPARYNGPPHSANGGYACGLLAGRANFSNEPFSAAAVTLLVPPPLETPLEFRAGAKRASAWLGEELIATVAPATGAIPVVATVPASIARAASDRYPGRSAHPFPTCFVCGTHRPESDGLFLSPGPVPDDPERVACTWTPDSSVSNEEGHVRREVVWSVLDCPGGWTCDLGNAPMVLSRMTARISRLPLIGSTCVVVGRCERQQGRTATNVTALYDEEGTLLASASAVWTRT